MISNSNYRSGAVRSIPDSELPKRTTDLRSGGVQDRSSATNDISVLSVKPTVKIVVRGGKLVVVSK
jgi:hypothetical protein